MLNLKEMTMEELQQIEREVREEIENRNKSNQKQLVIYTHDCFGKSKYHMGKYRHWAKKAESVDTSKTNGYAFHGEFLDPRTENRVPEGAIIVETCGSGIKCYEVRKEEKILICEGASGTMATFIDKVAEIVQNG